MEFFSIFLSWESFSFSIEAIPFIKDTRSLERFSKSCTIKFSLWKICSSPWKIITESSAIIYVRPYRSTFRWVSNNTFYTSVITSNSSSFFSSPKIYTLTFRASLDTAILNSLSFKITFWFKSSSRKMEPFKSCNNE